MDGVHDMGGMQGFGSVVTADGDVVFHEEWERRQFALSVLTEVHRATIETMPAKEYLGAGYYERWLYSTERDLVRSGVIAPGEVDAWIARLGAGERAPTRNDPDRAREAAAEMRDTWVFPPATAASFTEGQGVRVRRMRPAGHTRCPRYVRGVRGQIRAVLGDDTLPDDGETVEAVYSVAFESSDLWGPTSDEPAFVVLVDLWESYLEPLEVADV
jgi:nitrile hydratase beta subunit